MDRGSDHDRQSSRIRTRSRCRRRSALAIVARIDQLAAVDVHDVDALQQLMYGLYALISLHLRKEEDLQLPAFDAAPREVTEAVIARMERATGHAHEHLH